MALVFVGERIREVRGGDEISEKTQSRNQERRTATINDSTSAAAQFNRKQDQSTREGERTRQGSCQIDT
jgi:hypothetical protein